MSFRYVINAMRRRKLRTFIIALALTIGVALVGALLALVDTQRQFNTQTAGARTGGYDLSISKSDLALSPLFPAADVEAVARSATSQIASAHPRIQAIVEGRSVDAVEGQALTLVALDAAKDTLISQELPGSRPAGMFSAVPDIGAIGGGFEDLAGGVYPPATGQVFLNSASAGLMGINVGDEILLTYAVPTPRQSGKTAAAGLSNSRLQGRFIVSGIGTLRGAGNDVSNPVVMNLSDAQRWLGAAAQANQLLLVWKTDTSDASDARVIVSRARDSGEDLRDALQSQLGPDFTVFLPKYGNLESSAQEYAFTQTFITLYGLLSMGIVGLMVNALMTTTVTEQKYDLAILRVLGAPRRNLFNVVILEVVLLGAVGTVFGLLLGRLINDQVIMPLLMSSLELPAGVSAQWSLDTVLIPTAITVIVLALATISPARAAAATKVMVVLNPAAADQPTLDDLAKLRERRADTNLLVAGFVLLAFSAVVLIVLPTVFFSGDTSGQVIVLFGSLLLMVIGISLIFYFVTTPLERLLVALYQLVSPTAGFFAGRYALRGKGRNALISLMIVMSGVLPVLLATQLALQDANIETDIRFGSGAPITASRSPAFGGFQFFQSETDADVRLTDEDVKAVAGQPGIGAIVGVADNLRNMQVGDRISLRTVQVNLIGVDGDLNKVLYRDLFRWTGGDATALTRLVTDRKAVIISEGLSQALDLKTGDTLRVNGAGSDHALELTIAAVAARVPGFGGYFTRSRNNAGESGVFMHIDTYRELLNDPALAPPDPNSRVLTALYATTQPGVDENEMLSALREYLGQTSELSVSATSEQVLQLRDGLAQGRIFIVLLTGLSMVTAIFGVLAVMYTAVMSRRVEIGMLKAVGASKGALRGIFMGEAMITTLAAGMAGIIAGTILGYAFELGQRLQSDRPLILAFDFSTAGFIVALVSLAALFSAALATQPVIRQKAITILRER